VNDNTEVRDELARLAGYEKRECENRTGIGSPIYCAWFKNGMPDGDIFNGYRDHPIPNTLDELLRLPPGWAWYRNQTHGLYAIKEDRSHLPVRVGNSGDIMLDAARLRLAVEKIEHERKGGQP